MSPIPLGILASAGGAAPAFELISTQVLTSSASSVTFSSIPATYKHLQIRLVAKTSKGTSTDYLRARINADTGANYRYHILEGDGFNVSSYQFGATSNDMLLGYIVSSAENANNFAPAIIDVLDYSSTVKNTTIRTLMGHESPVSNYRQINFSSGLWINTATVSSFQLFPQTGPNFVTGSRFSLYGIKG